MDNLGYEFLQNNVFEPKEILSKPVFSIISSLTGSGKTVFLSWMLSQGPKYDYTIVCCKTLEFNEYYKSKRNFMYQFNDFNDEFEKFVYDLIKNKKQGETVLIVVDDCITSSSFKKPKRDSENNTNLLDWVAVMGRHHDISLFCVVQKQSGLSTICRTNCRLFISFRCPNLKEKDYIVKEFLNVFDKPIDNRNLLNYITSEPYRAVIVSRLDPSLPEDKTIYMATAPLNSKVTGLIKKKQTFGTGPYFPESGSLISRLNVKKTPDKAKFEE